MLLLSLKDSATRYPYSEGELRADFPATSFPADLSRMAADSLADFDCYRVTATTPPLADSRTQRLVELEPELLGEEYVQGWDVQELDAAEQAVVLKEATPEAITRVQFKLALFDNGFMQEVKDTIAALGPNARERLLIIWDNTSYIKRDSTMVDEIIARTRIDELTMDEIFRAGATL